MTAKLVIIVVFETISIKIPIEPEKSVADLMQMAAIRFQKKQNMDRVSVDELYDKNEAALCEEDRIGDLCKDEEKLYARYTINNIKYRALLPHEGMVKPTRALATHPTDIADLTAGGMRVVLNCCGIRVEESRNLVKWPIPRVYGGFSKPSEISRYELFTKIQEQFNPMERFVVSQKHLYYGFTTPEDDSYAWRTDYRLSLNESNDDQTIMLPFVVSTFHLDTDLGRYMGYLTSAMLFNLRPMILCVTNMDKAHVILYFDGATIQIIKLTDIEEFLQTITSWLRFCYGARYDYRLLLSDSTNPLTRRFDDPIELLKRTLLATNNKPKKAKSSSSGFASSSVSSNFDHLSLSELLPNFIPKIDPHIAQLYRIKTYEEIIGKGRNGHVYLTLHNQKLAALKVCSISKKGPRVLKELLNEICILRYLNQRSFKYAPCLISEGYFEHCNKQYYAILTDYIPYRPVRLNKISNHAKEQLRKCLTELHSLDVIHGDIRFQNFLIGENSVHLIDYGFSRTELDPNVKEKELIKLESCFED